MRTIEQRSRLEPEIKIIWEEQLVDPPIDYKQCTLKLCTDIILALMLVLVKCYDNKMVKATLHLFHPFADSALGG